MTDEQKERFIKKLYAKIQSGKKLTPDEMQYLRQNDPVTYMKVARVQAQREAFETQLNNCKSKEEAQDLYLDKVSRISEDKYNSIYISDEGETYHINDNQVKNTSKGFWSIALFGIDTRIGEENQSGVRSDSIMVLSINRDNGECNAVSIYRDSLVNIYNTQEYAKVNEAYTRGGALEAVNTLNQNLDLEINDYVVVNFSGLANIIDILGGVDLNITDNELEYINAYLDDNMANTGMYSEKLTESGNVHLNGLQTLAYCRIRYTDFYGDDGVVYKYDMGRTARQRVVMTKLRRILNTILGNDKKWIFTNIAHDDAINSLSLALKFKIVSSQGFPFDYDFLSYNGADVVTAHSWETDVKKLHNILYGDNGYEISNTVRMINDRLELIMNGC